MNTTKSVEKMTQFNILFKDGIGFDAFELDKIVCKFWKVKPREDFFARPKNREDFQDGQLGDAYFRVTPTWRDSLGFSITSRRKGGWDGVKKSLLTAFKDKEKGAKTEYWQLALFLKKEGFKLLP